MIQINNIKVSLEEDKHEIIESTIKKLMGEDCEYEIVKESIDARRGICFIYTVNVETDRRDLRPNKKIVFKYLDIKEKEVLKKGNIKLKTPPSPIVH